MSKKGHFSFLDRFRRVTGRKKFISEIDGLRFLAIMPVLFLHMNTHFKRVTPIDFMEDPSVSFFDNMFLRGEVGVWVFFAISGFILALPFANHHLNQGREINLKGYFRKRLTRLEPPYFITLVLFLGVHLFFLDKDFGELFPNFTASFFYVHNIVFGTWSKINPVAWSLEIEIQFYLLVPLITRVFAIDNPVRRRLTILFFMFFFLWVSLFVPLRQWNLGASILTHFHYFMVGFLVADIYLTEWKDGYKKSYWYDLLGLAALPTPFLFKDGPLFLKFLVPVGLFLVFIAVFKSRIINKFFTLPIITIIGGMCYTIYLIHYPLIAFILLKTRNIHIGADYEVNIILQTFIVVPLVIIISAILYLIIEKPFMYGDWPEKVAGFFKGKKVEEINSN